MRYPIVFATLAAALVLVTLNETDNRILRGSKNALPILNAGSDLSTAADDTRQSADNVAEQSVDDNRTPEVTEQPIRLNLKLPEMEWDDHSYGNSDAFPNVFGKQPSNSVVHWSGRLHLDDSEEAKTKPLNETILGAELELELKLP